MNNINRVALHTLVRKEVIRFTRIWSQTLLPPMITMSLYFILFGKLVGSQLNLIQGFTYMQFIAPGLIMMTIIMNAYNNVVASFFNMRFQRSIDELLVSPTANWVILLGFTMGGMLRGIVVGFFVSLLALCFTKLHVMHFATLCFVTLFTSAFFSLAGFTNALFARKFDDISVIPSFVLTPLTYLGGVFYSIQQLPLHWQWIAKLNPILYMVNAFRYSLLGIQDMNASFSLYIIGIATMTLFAINLYLLNKGIGLKS